VKADLELLELLLAPFDLILQAAIRTRSTSLSEFLRKILVRQSRTLSHTKAAANGKSSLVA